MDNERYVNVFWGSEPFDRQSSDSLTNKWYFFKPVSGNLAPSACLPHKLLSVVPYSGGYPTGYGRNNSSCCSVPSKFTKNKIIYGFTHFSESGTGYIEYFYNYFLISPTGGKQRIIKEEAIPGEYKVETKKYNAKVTVGNDMTACYQIEQKTKGELKIYPGFAGLKYKYVRPKFGQWDVIIDGKNLVFSVNHSEIKLSFALSFYDDITVSKHKNYVAIATKNDKFCFSLTCSFTEAKPQILSYEQVREKGKDEWKKVFDKVEIQANQRTKKLFYTALYNAMKKPCFYEDKMFDIATMWDMYKQQLPLMFFLYPDQGEKYIQCVSQCMGKEGIFKNAHLMTTDRPDICKGQAICLTPITIMTAKNYGIKGDYDSLIPLIKQDIEAHFVGDNFANFTNGSHYLDLMDAIVVCDTMFNNAKYNVAITTVIKQIFGNAILKDDPQKSYYEGTKYNYSFRVGGGTELRLKYLNHKNVIEELDKFFGFTGGDVINFDKHKTNPFKVNKMGRKYKRFEGFNNEPDGDAPYLYHYLKRYDRTNDILRSMFYHQINTSNGGLTGNDDSGGLTSAICWIVMGLYPVAGTDTILITEPMADKITINFDNPFTIIKKQSPNLKFYATLNGNEVLDNKLTVSGIQQGGELIIYC